MKRESMIDRLKAGEVFDVLVIGGVARVARGIGGARRFCARHVEPFDETGARVCF